MIYFIQHVFVHIGDLNRYANQIELAQVFYHYALRTIPYLGQPYNQIAILHEMKQSRSKSTYEQNQLLIIYYYMRSIAIKVTFPSAIANLEKFFQRSKDLSLTSIDEITNDDEFVRFFLQLIATIHLNRASQHMDMYMSFFRATLMKYVCRIDILHVLTIIIFTLHRTAGYLSLSSKTSDEQFNLSLQLLIIVIEKCLETIQMPVSMMIVDEQQILPVLYLSFAYLVHLEQVHGHIFQHDRFHRLSNMWNSLAKLLRSFSVAARNLQINNGKCAI
jgi:hypothetical protein